MLGLALEPGVPETPPARWRVPVRVPARPPRRGGDTTRSTRGVPTRRREVQSHAAVTLARSAVATRPSKFERVAPRSLNLPRVPTATPRRKSRPPRLHRRVRRRLSGSPVDDRIMGGSSTSLITHSDGATTFSGDLIVEGGGFASARFEQPFERGRDVEALELDAEGDGRLGYKLTMRGAPRRTRRSRTRRAPALTARLAARRSRASARRAAASRRPTRAAARRGRVRPRADAVALRGGGRRQGVDPGRRVLPDAAPAQHGRERARNQRSALAPPARRRRPSMCAAAAAARRADARRLRGGGTRAPAARCGRRASGRRSASSSRGRAAARWRAATRRSPSS